MCTYYEYECHHMVVTVTINNIIIYIYLLMYKLNHEYIRTYVVSYLFTNLYNC